MRVPIISISSMCLFLRSQYRGCQIIVFLVQEITKKLQNFQIKLNSKCLSTFHNCEGKLLQPQIKCLPFFEIFDIFKNGYGLPACFNFLFKPLYKMVNASPQQISPGIQKQFHLRMKISIKPQTFFKLLHYNVINITGYQYV